MDVSENTTFEHIIFHDGRTDGRTPRVYTYSFEIHATLLKLPPSTVLWLFSTTAESLLTEGEQEEERMGGLPGERCPEEARLGGEAVKRSHQMCWHVMITPGCSRVRGLTGRLSLWLTSAGLFIISYSQDHDGASSLLLLIWSLHTCTSLCTDTQPCGKTQPPKNRLLQHVCWVNPLHLWSEDLWKDLDFLSSAVSNKKKWE